MPAREASESSRTSAAAIPAAVSGWLMPGLGHLILGRRKRGVAFFAVVVSMFALGLLLKGALVPLDTSQPLMFLAGLAEVGVGLPYFVAKLTGLGGGDITAVTYEYGYTFCIVAGLLNALIVLDAYDVAVGRKS